MDNQFERLARGSLYLLLGDITASIVGAVFWIILARMLDSVHIGQAMIVIALMTSIIAFIGSGVQTALAKYIAEYNAKGNYKESRRIIKIGLIISLLIGTVVGIILFLLSDNISIIYSSGEGIAFLISLASLSYVPANVIVASISSIYTAYHKTQYVLLTAVIFQASRLIASITLVMYGFEALAIIAGFSIASIINSALGYIIMQRVSKHYIKDIKDVKERGEDVEANDLNKVSVKALLTFSGYNYIATGLRTLRNQIGVLTVGAYSIELSAFYGISSLIASVVGQVMISIASMLLPTVSEEIVKGNRDGVKHLFSIAMRIALVLNGFLALLLLIEPTYILRMISHSYVEASVALRILVIAYLIGSTSNLMASMLNAVNRAKDIAVRESISSTIIVVLTPLLVPILGMEGAAIALLVGSLSNLVLLYMVIRRQGFALSMSVYRAALSIAVAFTLGYILLIVYGSTLIALILALSVHMLFSLAVKAITRKEISTIISVIITRGR